MYDAVIGRFTGVDPISDQFPELSVYNYASNEPIANFDLHGLQSVPFYQKDVENTLRPIWNWFKANIIESGGYDYEGKQQKYNEQNSFLPA